jgi:hypothetical protein
MMKRDKKSNRVRASVYPTLHNKIWFSSGRIPLYNYNTKSKNINFSVIDAKGDEI